MHPYLEGAAALVLRSDGDGLVFGRARHHLPNDSKIPRQHVRVWWSPEAGAWAGQALSKTSAFVERLGATSKLPTVPKQCLLADGDVLHFRRRGDTHPLRVAVRSATMAADDCDEVRALVTRMSANQWAEAASVCTADAMFNPPGAPPMSIPALQGMMARAYVAFPDWRSMVHSVAKSADGTYEVLTQQLIGAMRADLPAMGQFPAVALADAPPLMQQELKLPVEVGTYTVVGGKITRGVYSGTTRTVEGVVVSPEVRAIWNKKGDLSDVGFGCLYQMLGVAPAWAPPDPPLDPPPDPPADPPPVFHASDPAADLPADDDRTERLARLRQAQAQLKRPVKPEGLQAASALVGSGASAEPEPSAPPLSLAAGVDIRDESFFRRPRIASAEEGAPSEVSEVNTEVVAVTSGAVTTAAELGAAIRDAAAGERTAELESLWRSHGSAAASEGLLWRQAVDLPDGDGRTAVHIACEGGLDSVVEALAACGADLGGAFLPSPRQSLNGVRIPSHSP
jgi:hypothetical protein